ncbi:DUF2244 domain-containing protein [Endozoicomonas sp. SCSIO W0465]|uniref:DUF2244 domain-containing protein n=1 Tax=Endozoicomonas sp. SCSIO W0465 TaxID=2918516 RepID=UPI002075E88C|nr:DUF2244 domain-containing protein [Endozoicomonas sp. SCSIO W0465]USE38480.1 DUF2244 domain-containing protein [Endozoicomonas sp. SCSIO W0465]
MVTINFAPKSRDGSILLQPNNSMSWRQNLLLLGLIVTVSLAIAVGFYLAGAKAILPFSMLEVIALSAGIYYCAWQRQRKELITFQEHQVTVQKGFYQPLSTHHYHRLWCQLVIHEAAHPWQTPSIHIRSHGKELELGSFLNRQDKLILLDHLKRLLNNTHIAQ